MEIDYITFVFLLSLLLVSYCVAHVAISKLIDETYSKGFDDGWETALEGSVHYD